MNFEPREENIGKCIAYIRSELEKEKIKPRRIAQTILASEGLLRVFVRKSDGASKIDASVKKFLGNYYVEITGTGAPFHKDELSFANITEINFSPEERLVIEGLTTKAIGENLKISCRSGFNSATVTIIKSPYKSLIIMLAALAGGLAFGACMKAFAPEFALLASSGVLQVLYTMFLGALNTFAAPLGFMAMVISISGFHDIRSVGRVGIKVFFLYLFFSVIAIVIGFATYGLFPIGDPSLQNALKDAATSFIQTDGIAGDSLKSTIQGIIPSDIVTPFLNVNTLQLIFVAVLMGVAVSQVGKESVFRDFLLSANDVLKKCLGFVLKLVPVSGFCMAAKMMIDMDSDSIAKVAVWLPTAYFGLVCMLLFYCLMLLVLVRMNPLKFLKKFSPAIVTAISTASSSATVPVAKQMCGERLKISSRLYSFSIPFGTSMNLDGSCISLVITLLFMMKTFEIAVTPSLILFIVLATLLLSMGNSGIPGGNIVYLFVLMPMLGIPVEAAGLIVVLYAFVEVGLAVTNVIGNAVVTTIVAKSEGMIEKE